MGLPILQLWVIIPYLLQTLQVKLYAFCKLRICKNFGIVSMNVPVLALQIYNVRKDATIYLHAGKEKP